MPTLDLGVALPIIEGEKLGVLVSGGSVQLQISGVNGGTFSDDNPEISGPLVGGDYIFTQISGSPVIEYWYV